jgi:hypothetical protein
VAGRTAGSSLPPACGCRVPKGQEAAAPIGAVAADGFDVVGFTARACEVVAVAPPALASAPALAPAEVTAFFRGAGLRASPAPPAVLGWVAATGADFLAGPEPRPGATLADPPTFPCFGASLEVFAGRA